MRNEKQEAEFVVFEKKGEPFSTGSPGMKEMSECAKKGFR
jgi:hypothetical protein